MIGRKPQQTRLKNGVARCESFIPLGREREIDHHDRVLLHDPDQQNDADQGNDAQVRIEDDQRDQRAQARPKEASR